MASVLFVMLSNAASMPGIDYVVLAYGVAIMVANCFDAFFASGVEISCHKDVTIHLLSLCVQHVSVNIWIQLGGTGDA